MCCCQKSKGSVTLIGVDGNRLTLRPGDTYTPRLSFNEGPNLSHFDVRLRPIKIESID